MTGSGQSTPQQVPGVGGPPPPAKPRGISVRTKITVALAAAGVVGGAAWAGTAVIGRPTAPVAQVQLESTSSAGTSPFMSPVGVDRSDLSPPAGSTGDFSGDTPGLFADNGDKPSCDAPALTAALGSDPVKAAAWAEALGIRTEETAAYVATLTPVVLRSDTAVTSHGYENGSFSAYPAVLQAGTAVFVNGHGEPRVKCFSGNPLTESTSPAQATYVGPGWGHFQPSSVSVIRPAPAVINNYVVIDVEHGRPASRPGKPPWNGGGGNGKPGGNGAPTPNPVLEAKAKEAAARAEQAAKEAAAARAIADDKQTAARIFATEARNRADADAAKLIELQQAGQAAGRAQQARDAALAAALAAPADAAKQAAFRLADTEFQKSLAVFADKANERAATSAAAAKAKAEAEEKANQAKFAEAAARSAEGTRKAAEDEAKKAKEAAEAAARGGRKAPAAVANEVAGIAPGIATQDGTPAEVDEQVTDPAVGVEGAEQGTAGEPGTATDQNPAPGQGEQPLDGEAPQVDEAGKPGSPGAPEQQVQPDGDTEPTEAGR
jgi:hypothetical protein